ncbi:MAG: hypothetical protein JWM44_1174, partial [Bacilli bacterium]|nr:hypothetical protein [Bacilli bacterium]
FAKDNNIEDMTARELAQAIKDKKALEKQLEESKEEIELARTDYSELSFEIAEQEAAVNKLKEELKAAIELSENSTAKKLRDSLKKAESDHAESVKKVKELEAELKKKPIDVPATTTVEVIPEETQKELETLRKAKEELATQILQANQEADKKIAAMQSELEKNNNTELISVRTAVKALSHHFEVVLSAIGEIKNPDEREALKNNVKVLLDRLKEAVV